MRIIPVSRFDAPVLDERFTQMIDRQFDNGEEIVRTLRDCPQEMSVLAYTMLRTLDNHRENESAKE